MTFEELAIAYTILDTIITGGEGVRAVYRWIKDRIERECEAWDKGYRTYLEALKKIATSLKATKYQILFGRAMTVI